jgi:hypothetical protein
MVASAGMEFSPRMAGAEQGKTLGEMKSPAASLLSTGPSTGVQTAPYGMQGLVPSWKASLASAGLTSEGPALEENALQQAVPEGTPGAGSGIGTVLSETSATALPQNEKPTGSTSRQPVPSRLGKRASLDGRDAIVSEGNRIALPPESVAVSSTRLPPKVSGLNETREASRREEKAGSPAQVDGSISSPLSNGAAAQQIAPAPAAFPVQGPATAAEKPDQAAHASGAAIGSAVAPDSEPGTAIPARIGMREADSLVSAKTPSSSTPTQRAQQTASSSMQHQGMDATNGSSPQNGPEDPEPPAPDDAIAQFATAQTPIAPRASIAATSTGLRDLSAQAANNSYRETNHPDPIEGQPKTAAPQASADRSDRFAGHADASSDAKSVHGTAAIEEQGKPTHIDSVPGNTSPQLHQQLPQQQQPGFLPGRDGAVIQAGAELSGKHASSLATDAAADTHEAFAAMDSGTGSVAPTWFHAGANQAEAGFRDPGLGWVGVRAQSDASGVHAAVVPNSAEASQILSGHLAGLNAYLAEGHTGVASVSLTAPESRLSEQGTLEQSPGRGYEGTGGQGTGQQGNSGGAETPHVSASSSEYVSPLPIQNAGQTDMPPPGNSGGGHISVMA